MPEAIQGSSARWIAGLMRDLAYGLRQLRKAPGFALLAVGTLAFGVGANTAMFAVIEGVLLRPLPYAGANRLMYVQPVSATQTPGAPSFSNTSWLNYRDIRAATEGDQSRGPLEAAAAYAEDQGVVETADGSESVVTSHVTPSVFRILGARPLLGRTFTEAEGLAGGGQVAVLSEDLWRRSFHADPKIIGQAVKVSGVARTVVGVMPDNFQFPEEAGADVRKGIWLPLQPTGQMLALRGFNFMGIAGQLRRGASVAQAQEELKAIAQSIRKADPDGAPHLAFRLTPYQQVLTEASRPMLLGLLGALALVLLIACANVSNLLLARAIGRQQEFTVRTALGAGRWRLVSQMLTEGALLSGLGCGVGVALAEAVLLAVKKLPADTIPRADAIGLDWRVIAALALAATGTTLLSSLVPALLVARIEPQAGLQGGSRAVGSRSVSRRLSGALVMGEVALSTLLLVGTGLLFHTIWNLERSRLGFDTRHMTTFTAIPEDAAGLAGFAVTGAKDAPVSIAVTTYAPLLHRIQQLPGVEQVALASAPPLSGFDLYTGFTIVGLPQDKQKNNGARMSAVGGEYARTMGTPVLQGRMVNDEDGATTPFVLVINEALAKKYFKGQDPLQHQLDLGGKDTGMMKPYTIVGVLADQVDDKVGAEVQPLIMLPETQVLATSLFYAALLNSQVGFVVRTRGNVAVAGEMRTIFHQMAPGFALQDFKTLQEAVDQSTFSQRLGLYLIASFAGLAVLMVIAGLYGVLSQVVSYRRREIGIRMALGATRQSVASMVMQQGGALIAAGLMVGMIGALAAGRLVAGFLYQVKPVDGWAYAGAALALAVIGLVAAVIPARRAAAIEPMEALRSE